MRFLEDLPKRLVVSLYTKLVSVRLLVRSHQLSKRVLSLSCMPHAYQPFWTQRAAGG